MRHYLGIDPGLGGGLALMTAQGLVVWAKKMPDTDRDLLDLVVSAREDGAPPGTTHAVIELVHTSPQMGVKSAGTFMMGYGKLLMALTAATIPFDTVRPQKWQGAMNCLTGGQKNITKLKAQQLFPTLKVTHHIADALLIAEWARRVHNTLPTVVNEVRARQRDPEGELFP